jgi:L-serine dehydratase
MNYISVFDMLKIGIGPSSSHTLGPWKAAQRFLAETPPGILLKTDSLNIILYGSLALTGKGHATDKAILLGLAGYDPETSSIQDIRTFLSNQPLIDHLTLSNQKTIPFRVEKNIDFRKNEVLPFHSNALSFELNGDGQIFNQTFYSIGGGFVVKEGETFSGSVAAPPYPCQNASDLLKACEKNKCSISEIVLKNEMQFLSESEIRSKLLKIWTVMKEAAYLGCHTEGVLPGGLMVVRRAAQLNKQLIRKTDYSNADEWIEAMMEGRDFRKVLTRISCLAIAVNEVNADMGRIVTAPTNGSAGVIPAVLLYYWCFSGQKASEENVIRFLLTAAEIGKYFKIGATISAAAGGCQAEIGVSSSMAAAGLTECLGGTPGQVLMAAEIAAEHHLGMTCDPIAGLVQIPCIERNSMGAIKAVTAAMIALESNPDLAKVSLDQVIKSMKETAENMNTRFKETSLGGLATNVSVNLPEC